MLIDAGNNEDGPKLVNYFKKQNISNFDYVIGTHPHEDHIGGLDDVIENFNKDNTNCEFDVKSFEGTDTAQIELPYIYYIQFALICQLINLIIKKTARSQACPTSDSSEFL